MCHFRRSLTLLVLALLTATGGLAQSPAQASNEVRMDSLMAAYDRPDSPGAAVLVFRGGETLFSRGYGMATLEYDVPIAPSTVFHVASVSKQFTAFAIAMLAAEGRLSLDDEVRTYIPDLPDFDEPVTLRQVLHHTSGLRDQWNLWVLAGGRMDDVIRQDDLFRLVTRQQELNFAPGAEHLYSNSGYMLAAKVVESVTGESFGEWLHRNVLEPMGMNSTQVYDDHERLVPGRAYSYRHGEEGGFRKAVLSYANSGATSLFTTTGDLALWLRNFGDPGVGGTAVNRMMLNRGILTAGDTISYALGVTMDAFRGLEMVQHGGADAGFRSYVAYFPALDAGVVVLSNLASFNPGGMTRRITEVFFEEHMAPAEVAEPVTISEGVTLPTATLERLTGRWQIEGAAMELTVERDRNRLFAQVPQMGRAELVALSDSTFRVIDVGAEVTFNRHPSGAVEQGSLLLQNGSQMALRRLDHAAPTPAELQALAGRYYSAELETLYTVLEDDGRLIARHRRHGDIALTPEQNGRFTGDKWFFGDVAFERDADGAVTKMRVSSGRVRNLAFEKLD